MTYPITPQDLRWCFIVGMITGCFLMAFVYMGLDYMRDKSKRQ